MRMLTKWATYITDYEIGRAECLRSVGFPYKRLEEEGVMCPVASIRIRFLRAPQYDELITIRTRVKKLPGTSVTFYACYVRNFSYGSFVGKWEAR